MAAILSRGDEVTCTYYQNMLAFPVLQIIYNSTPVNEAAIK